MQWDRRVQLLHPPINTNSLNCINTADASQLFADTIIWAKSSSLLYRNQYLPFRVRLRLTSEPNEIPRAHRHVGHKAFYFPLFIWHYKPAIIFSYGLDTEMNLLRATRYTNISLCLPHNRGAITSNAHIYGCSPDVMQRIKKRFKFRFQEKSSMTTAGS